MRSLLALLAILLTASLVFSITTGGSSSSSTSGGTSSSDSFPAPTPEIFVTGECSEEIVFLGAASNGTAISNGNFLITLFSRTRSPRTLTPLTTDSNGVAKFNASEAGLYQAEFSSSGFQTTKASFNIEDCSVRTKPEIEPPALDNTTADELREANLSCSDFPKPRERVKCRITLPGDVALLRYLPEECRPLNGTERAKCIQDYTWQQGCRHLEKDSAREKCYRDQINLTSDVRGEKLACGDNSSCINNLREKVFGYVKFRIYNIEEKAEELLERGLLTEDEAVDFITFLEEQKIEFNKNASVQSKKSVIRTVQSEWKTIREGVVDLLRSRSKQ